MSVALPQAVRVGAIWWRVFADHRRIDHGNAGECDLRHSEIRVDPTDCPQRQRVTLLHEIVHAVLDQAGWRHQGDDVKYTVEQFLDAICPGLAAALQENTPLVAYLTEREYPTA